MAIIFNEQQKGVQSWVWNGTGSLNLVARAGCGKTSTLIGLLDALDGRVFLGAYNKAIADELKVRVGRRPMVEAATWHSIGYRLLRQLFPTLESPESNKVKGLCLSAWKWDRKYAKVVAEIVGYAKQAGFGIPGCPMINDEKAWTETMDHYDVWEDIPAGISPDRAIKDCQRIYRTSLDLIFQEGRIDFDDMILGPLYYADGDKPELYDWVLVDEAQDTNQVRRLLAKLVLKTGTGRMIAVGDDRQAIYGFAGANHDSMELIKRDNAAKELPLSITYRCAKAIVAVANTWVPDITVHESAPEGEVRTITHSKGRVDAFWQEQFTTSDVILCRNTFPLLGIAQRLRKMGVACVVEGNSSKAIIALVNHWGDVDIQTLMWNLDEWEKDQKAKWGEEGKNRPEKLEAAMERLATVKHMAEGLAETDPVRKLTAKIEDMFGDGADDRDILRLCTIHRSKGREWNRVYLIGRNVYQPSKWAKQEWELTQEDNLAYVAVTRAKNVLVEVEVPTKKGPEDPDWWEL